MKKMILGLLFLTLIGCENQEIKNNKVESLIEGVNITLPDQRDESDSTLVDVDSDKPDQVEIDLHKEAKEMYQPELYNYDSSIIEIIKNPDTLYVMGNKYNQLPESFIPENLVEPNVSFSFSGDDQKKKMVKVAADALEHLFEGAKDDGYNIVAVSGYRSFERQKSVYNHWVSLYGVEEADKFSARPGHSEHQTGLTMDVSCSALNYQLEYELGEMPEGIWLKEHAHNFGFIIRYPEDKTEITGYNYEPWHLRFVGKDLAKILYDQHLTIEEYFYSLIN